jgi:hypothetical protein
MATNAKSNGRVKVKTSSPGSKTVHKTFEAGSPEATKLFDELGESPLGKALAALPDNGKGYTIGWKDARDKLRKICFLKTTIRNKSFTWEEYFVRGELDFNVFDITITEFAIRGYENIQKMIALYESEKENDKKETGGEDE